MPPDAKESNSKRIKIGPKQKIAFVCSGGAVKAGAFHLGVALALQEHGFKFCGGLKPPHYDPDSHAHNPMEIGMYVGSSAGSVIATYLAAGYSLENIFNSFLGKEPTHESEAIPRVLPKITYQTLFKLRSELAKEQIKHFLLLKNIFSNLVAGNWESLIAFKWLKTTGLFSTLGLEQFLREDVLLSNRFEDYLADLFIVGTQLNHSRKTIFGKIYREPDDSDIFNALYSKEVSISDACAASMALPFVFAPYEINHTDRGLTHYIDGEIRDTLSSHVAEENGADLIIASYTHQPYHYVESIGSLTKLGLPAILVQSIYLAIEQKINKHIHFQKIRGTAIDEVNTYCRKNNIDNKHRQEICRILEKELEYRRDVDRIYIHPKPTDPKMFVREHFSLSPRKMSEVVRGGFRAATEILDRYEFADKQDSPVVNEVNA